MTEEVKQLITETIELTGAAPPTLMDADAPVLAAPAEAQSIYLIGLVGGKDVGKSSLVNALVGQAISSPTSHGPGTEKVIAYVHASAVPQLQQLLQREVPGQFTIVPHTVDRISRQVLLDLPDVDSRYSEHVQITRRMLRHMLYPLWIQSVEKYADRRPQELLSAVADGNDPANFIFCLNKADQLQPDACEELRIDFASRIARTIKLPSSPNVFLISATHPQQFDLPALRELLSQEKPASVVKASLGLAARRQDRSLFGWVQRQRLPDRAAQLDRLLSDAEELTATRIALPLLEGAVPRLLDDPAQRMAMLTPAIRRRMSRWPVVNAIDSLFSPILALVQKNLSSSATSSADPDTYLIGSTVSANVQAAFAQLQQLHPELGTFYPDRKLWEAMHSDLASAELRRRFTGALERQQQAILQRAGGRFGFVFAPVRWLLTIGAILWFPLVQPLLSAMRSDDAWRITLTGALGVVVDNLSVSHLLQCVTFLLLWFFILWAVLRWRIQRRVNRTIDRWKAADAADDLSLSGQTIQWIDDMLEPIQQRKQRIEQILRRAGQMQDELSAESPAASHAAPEPNLA